MLWKRNRVVTSQDADETFSRDPFEFGREYAVFLSTCAAFLSFGVMVPLFYFFSNFCCCWSPTCLSYSLSCGKRGKSEKKV